MSISILIASYGQESWRELAWSRAFPSADIQGAKEVLIFHDPKGTIASVRNELAAQAKGDWLCVLDADDELAPGFIDVMERAAENQAKDVLLTPAVQQIRSNKAGTPFFFPECSFETGNWLIVGTLVQRDLFYKVGGFEDYPHGLEDWQLWAKCVKAGARIVKVPNAVYRAYYNKRSKHHLLLRDRHEYMRQYNKAKESVWG